MGAGSRRAVAPVFVLTFVAACATSPSSGPRAAASETSAPSTVWDGVYTAVQADRGRAAYGEACSSCHATDLRGNSNAPSLVGVSFMFLWENRSLEELYGLIRTEMPTNAPNSLPDQTYLDVLTYLLSANGFPAGAAELGLDSERLASITLTGSVD